MITTRYTNLTEILERVRRDYGFEEVYYDECKEWVWDVIGFMGAPELLIPKTQTIPIRNWRGELPIDVYDLKDHLLRESKSGRVMTLSTEVFMKDDVVKDRDSIIMYDESVNFDEDAERVPGVKYASIISTLYDIDDYAYKIQGDFIFTAIKEGEVELSYTAFPMDEKKLEPLIPDEPKAIRAVVNYLAERIAFRLMMVDKLSERKYEGIKQEYLFNVGAAITKARIQSVPELENLKNRTLQIMKDLHPYRRGFK